MISMDDIPESSLKLFGYSHRERIDNMVTDVIANSTDRDEIFQSERLQRRAEQAQEFHVFPRLQEQQGQERRGSGQSGSCHKVFI